MQFVVLWYKYIRGGTGVCFYVKMHFSIEHMYITITIITNVLSDALTSCRIITYSPEVQFSYNKFDNTYTENKKRLLSKQAKPIYSLALDEPFLVETKNYPRMYDPSMTNCLILSACHVYIPLRNNLTLSFFYNLFLALLFIYSKANWIFESLFFYRHWTVASFHRV